MSDSLSVPAQQNPLPGAFDGPPAAGPATDTRPANQPPSLAASLPFEEMFEHAPMAAGLTRRSDGLVLAVNTAWEALTRVSRAEVVGRTTVEIGHWADAAERERLLASMQGQGRYLCLPLRGGQRLHVRLHASALPGDPSLLLVYLIDIGHEVEAEQQRDRSQQALSELNRQLQRQVELHGAIEKLARVGYWANAQGDEEVVWSEGLHEITGLGPGGRLLRHEGRGGIHPDDMPAWLAAREACDGRVVEFRWRHPNGEQRWFRTRISQTEVASATRTDFGVVQDITTEKEVTQALADQLELLQNTAARVPGILYKARLTADGQGRFLFLSQAAVEMFELDRFELLRNGDLLLTRVHPDDREVFLRSLSRAARERVLWRQQLRMQLPRQGRRWYSVEAMPQAEPDGSVVWYGYVHDVTDARLAAHALERQHRMLDAVRRAQTVFIEADDKQRAFEDLLDAFLSVTGSEHGFVGDVLYDSRGRPYLKTCVMSAMASGGASPGEYRRDAGESMAFLPHRSLLGHAMVSGEVVIANRHGSEPPGGDALPGQPVADAFLGIPIALGGRVMALVGLSGQGDGYNEADVEFLQPLLGAVRQLALAWRDHDERHRSRLQLQATSALLAEKSAALQVTLDSISQGLAKIDAVGRITIYNRRLLELLDLPDALLSGQPARERVLQHLQARGESVSESLFSLPQPQTDRLWAGAGAGARVPALFWHHTQDGRTLEVHTRTLPGGGAVQTCTDVTPYIATQEALRDERQRLAWVLEATGPGIWELNLLNGETLYSERWAALLGFQLDELRPYSVRTWGERVHPEDKTRALEQVVAHLRNQTPHYECDLRMRHKDGRWLWFNDRGRVHRRDAQGRALFMSGTLLDIHARVTAQQEVRALNASLERRVAERTAELERSMKDMEAISYSIAHDLRAPLRSVNGFAALLADTEGDRLSPAGLEMFERITRSSRNMGQLISDMLELLRVVRVEIEAQPVDMDALARSVVEALAPAVPHARVGIGSLPRVLGDTTLLRQVLANLMDNALKYSRHRAEPVVDIGFETGRSAFYLRDNGSGFDMSRAEKLFGLFQRLHAGAQAPEGTGVGLAIVARTVERHGGRIWAEAAPGRGATFWWTLPLA